MKNHLLFLPVCFGVLMLYSCNNNNSKNDNNGNDTTMTNNDTIQASPSGNNGANGPASTIDDKTADFMKEAASGGMMEVAVGKLALQKSSNKEVKAMAQMLIDDHTKANDKLKAIAQEKNVTLPDSMMDKQKDNYDDLAKESGKDFDKKFADMAVDDHKDDMDKFTKAADDIKDSTVLRWVTETIPVLKKHLDHAQQLKDKMK